MSQENVENARRLIEAWNRNDLDAFVSLLHPEVEWHDRALFPDAGVHRGRASVARHLHGVAESVDVRWEIRGVVDGGDNVVIEAFLSGKGSSSGAGFQDRVFAVAHFQNGLVLRRESFSSRAEALEAAGLSDSLK